MTIADLTPYPPMSLYVGPGASAGVTSSILLPDAMQLTLSESVPIALCRQTHSLNIAVVESEDEYPFDTDALITFRPGLAVGVRTADCVPIVLHAPDIRGVAAVHAGWRGTLGRIVQRCIDKMVTMGARPDLMYASIGPCICSDCYEVDKELGNRFSSAGFSTCVSSSGPERPSKAQLDLRLCNYLQLIEKGLRKENIEVSEACTRHTAIDKVYPFPSYRRENGTEERLVTFVFLT